MAKKNKNYTIDDLALAVAKGFEEVNNNFDKKFDQMDKRFVQMDQKNDSVKFELSKKIEDEVRSVKAEISLGIKELKGEIERLDQRIDRVLKQNHGDIDALIEEQEKIKSRLKKLELKNSHG